MELPELKLPMKYPQFYLSSLIDKLPKPEPFISPLEAPKPPPPKIKLEDKLTEFRSQYRGQNEIIDFAVWLGKEFYNAGSENTSDYNGLDYSFEEYLSQEYETSTDN